MTRKSDARNQRTHRLGVDLFAAHALELAAGEPALA